MWIFKCKILKIRGGKKKKKKKQVNLGSKCLLMHYGDEQSHNLSWACVCAVNMNTDTNVCTHTHKHYSNHSH